jgi:pSer/pThr/pTyr-binding forkhead associated (FHA) protein
MSLSWFLVTTERKFNKSSFKLTSKALLIGSDSICDVVIENRNVSDIHAKIWREGNSYFIENQDVTDDVFIEGTKINSSVELSPGCKIVIGEQSFTIEIKSTEETKLSSIKKKILSIVELPKHDSLLPKFGSILLEALFFTGLSLFIMIWLGFQEAGLFSIFLTASSLVHRLEHLLNENRHNIFVVQQNPVYASLQTAIGILMIFLGSCLAYFILATTYPETDLANLFGFIFETVRIENSTLFTREFSNLFSIFSHNILVMVTLFLLCFFYRVYAALLTLGWNSCVWVIVLVSLTKRSLNNDSYDSLSASLHIFLTVSPHIILEGAAYILAGLAAIFYSRGIVKYNLSLSPIKLESEASIAAIKLPKEEVLYNITITCIKMVGIGIIILLIAALLESTYVPWMLSKIKT